MIDHLCVAPDQATLIAAIGSIVPAGSRSPLWYAGDEDSPAGWRGDIAFEVQVSDQGAPVPNQYALWVALPAKDANLAASPTCILIADRDAANAGQPNFILQTALSSDQLNNYTISPVVAGSGYPFGAVTP